MYEMELDDTKVPYTETLKISQAVPPNDVDRFQFKVGDSDPKFVTLYLVDLTLVYNETNNKLFKENILLWPFSFREPPVLDDSSMFKDLYTGLHVEGAADVEETTNCSREILDEFFGPPYIEFCVAGNIIKLKNVLEMSSANYERLDYLRSLVNEAEQSFKPFELRRYMR